MSLNKVIDEGLRTHTDYALADGILTLSHLDNLTHHHAKHVIIHGTGHHTKPEVLVLLKEAAETLGGAFNEHVRSENWKTATG